MWLRGRAPLVSIEVITDPSGGTSGSHAGGNVKPNPTPKKGSQTG
jgi:hypothetical protein